MLVATILVADLVEIESSGIELLAQFLAMGDGRGEHHGLYRASEVLFGLVLPLRYDIADDIESAFLDFLLRPFSGDNLHALGIDRLGGVHAQRNQYALSDECVHRRDASPFVNGVAVRPITTASVDARNSTIFLRKQWASSTNTTDTSSGMPRRSMVCALQIWIRS